MRVYTTHVPEEGSDRRGIYWKCREYHQLNGTSYHIETPAQVRELLERIRRNGWRVRLYYGDTETGRDWGEAHDVTGTIGRSMGPVQVPILLNNSRSKGGSPILDHRIVKIDFSNKKDGGTLYQHPNFHAEP